MKTDEKNTLTFGADEIPCKECRLPDAITLLAPKNDHIGNVYEQGVWYEGIMLAYMRQFGGGLTFVDVGAFVGGHSVWMANMCNAKEVYAFEPNKALFQIMGENLYINGCDKVVTAKNVALGAKKGKGEMKERFTGNVGAHSVVAKRGGDVSIATLDSYELPHIDILKVDAEGMGAQVLEGARISITAHRPRIFIECATDVELDDAHAVLDPLGYFRGQVFNWTPTYEFIPRVTV